MGKRGCDQSLSERLKNLKALLSLSLSLSLSRKLDLLHHPQKLTYHIGFNLEREEEAKADFAC